MAYQVSWLVEKQVVLAKLYGEITIPSVVDMDVELLDHMRSGQEGRLIHLIFDVTGVDKFPVNIAQLNQVANSRHEPNMGWLMVINDNRMIKFIGNMITQLTQTRFRNFESVEMAIEFLKTQDSRIEWSLMNINEE